MSRVKPGYVVVEGPIGVGKTTLAKRLAATYETELLLEGADENPFLDRFYKNPKEAALPTQLFFLFQRARQAQELRQGDMFCPVRIADFLMEKDRMFAQLTLDDEELKLYYQVYSQLALDAPLPDLVIYLQAPVEVLMRRVQKRGIAIEQNIDQKYLQKICEAYTEFFYHYDQAPLLIVNAAEIDLVGNESDYQQLLAEMQTLEKGRHYFNPLPLDIS